MNYKKKEHLFTTGLLHDIGKVIFDQYLDEKYIKLLEEVEAESTNELAERERKIFGMDHGEIGALLLKKWKFPEEIVKTVAVHHYKDVKDDELKKDVAILKIADILCQRFFYKEEEAIPELIIPEKEMEIAGISNDYIEKLNDYIDDSKSKIYSFFSSVVK